MPIFSDTMDSWDDYDEEHDDLPDDSFLFGDEYEEDSEEDNWFYEGGRLDE